MFSLHRDHQKLLNKIIFIDGFSSTGKSLLSQMLSSLERFENWQIDYSFEQIAIAYYLNKISIDAVDSILNTKIDELTYNLFIGRNVNFRTTDQSSPFFINNQKKYLKRIKSIEGSSVVDRINESNPIIPLHVHYIYGHTDILLKSLINKISSYIIMLRDPFYLIDNWYQSNWPNIIGSSARDFHLNIKKNNLSAPWYSLEFFDEYVKSNNLEKSILTIFYYHKKLFDMIKNTEKKNYEKIMVIFFDDFISNPLKYVDRLCDITESKKSNFFFDLLKKSSLPRDINSPLSSKDLFFHKYKNEINPTFIKILEELDEMFNSFYIKNKII